MDRSINSSVENIRRFNQNESYQPGTSRCRYISSQNGFRCIGIYPSKSLDVNGFCEKHKMFVQLGTPGSEQSVKQCLLGSAADRMQIGIFGSSSGPSFHNRHSYFRHFSFDRSLVNMPFNQSAQRLTPYARPSAFSRSAQSTVLRRRTGFGQSFSRTAQRFGVSESCKRKPSNQAFFDHRSPVAVNNFEKKQLKSELEDEEKVPGVSTGEANLPNEAMHVNPRCKYFSNQVYLRCQYEGALNDEGLCRQHEAYVEKSRAYSMSRLKISFQN